MECGNGMFHLLIFKVVFESPFPVFQARIQFQKKKSISSAGLALLTLGRDSTSRKEPYMHKHSPNSKMRSFLHFTQWLLFCKHIDSKSITTPHFNGINTHIPGNPHLWIEMLIFIRADNQILWRSTSTIR